MVKKTIRKDYFISFVEGNYIVTKNPINANLSINEAVNKPFERYLFEVGDKIFPDEYAVSTRIVEILEDKPIETINKQEIDKAADTPSWTKNKKVLFI